jgi:PPOX class probable FMN-dependent enzyme
MDISTEAQLRARYKSPSERAVRKQLAALDPHARNFIAHSPFLVLGTAGADGSVDVSPKGDAPGFVAVVDDHTVLVPDRPGNNRLDGLRNVLENPHVALIFFIPGVDETLRVNGRARVTTDAALLAPLAVQGKVPATGLVVEVEEVFLHCAKALIRSRLWDPATRIERASFPTLGRMLADQIGGMDAEEADRYTQQAYRDTLY